MSNPILTVYWWETLHRRNVYQKLDLRFDHWNCITKMLFIPSGFFSPNHIDRLFPIDLNLFDKNMCPWLIIRMRSVTNFNPLKNDFDGYENSNWNPKSDFHYFICFSLFFFVFSTTTTRRKKINCSCPLNTKNEACVYINIVLCVLTYASLMKWGELSDIDDQNCVL